MKAVLINPFGVFFTLPESEDTRKKCFTEINYCKAVLNNPDEFQVIDGALEFVETLKNEKIKIVLVTNAYNQNIVSEILRKRGLPHKFVYSIHNHLEKTIKDIMSYLEIEDINEIAIISKRREDLSYAIDRGIKRVNMNSNSFTEALSAILSEK